LGAWSRADHYAADLQIGEKYKKGRESWEVGLREFLDGRFRGMFWKNVQIDFLEFFKR
jgi:hypothetical protein